jgi:hypothetical protein
MPLLIRWINQQRNRLAEPFAQIRDDPFSAARTSDAGN